jgi:hypothetical protein
MESGRYIRAVRYLVVVLLLCTASGACVDNRKPTSQPTSVRDRQEKALQDPFEYGPDEEMPTVSGGGRKGMKRDWDSFWK